MAIVAAVRRSIRNPQFLRGSRRRTGDG